MSEGIQMAIVGLVVVAAALYLLRKYLPRRRIAGGKITQDGVCGSCKRCNSGSCH
ncbi:FeoB-associated Cys-rich membrane protein [Vogesella fluminis]|uniref:FeoB-associated Cys-rich membrane protein n=1 Tax=Vogesella fluminis TaxID=1069161 RepID=A0ABQ3HDN7_9NEIS|nr:FeoB-associated Cys-rich membrane protein [Vogesella fluminis]GHD77348.1 hypothetical protein GCM10011419_17970 [Vogesella fluminis]